MSTPLPHLLRDPLGPGAYGRRGALLMLGLLAYCAFFELGTRSLHVFDTARWGTLAREMIRTGDWLVPHRYGELYVNKPPLYLWAVALPSALFGQVTPFWVRLPSALGLVVLVWTTVSWTRLRFASERLARTAGLITLTTLSVIWLGREGRLDMMSSALAVAAAYHWDRAALGHGTRFTPWWTGLLLGLALLTKGPPLLIAPIAILLTPGAGQRLGPRLRAARPWVVLPFAVGVALAWFVPAVLQAGWDEYGRKLLVDQASDRLAGQSTHTHGPLYYFGAIPLGMAPWGIAYVAVMLLVVRRGVRKKLGATAPIAIAGAAGLLLFLLVPTKHLRYLTPLVPLWAMPVARGTWHWIHRDDGFKVSFWMRLLAWSLVGYGVAALVLAAFARYDRSWTAGVTALPLLGLGVLLLRTPIEEGPTGRRRFAGSLMLGIAVILVAILTLRNKWLTTVKETFALAIAAELRPTDRIYTLHGTTPELIFHASDATRKLQHTHEVPWSTAPNARWVIVCHEDRVGEVESASGRRAKLIAARPDAHCVALVLPPSSDAAGD